MLLETSSETPNTQTYTADRLLRPQIGRGLQMIAIVYAADFV